MHSSPAAPRGTGVCQPSRTHSVVFDNAVPMGSEDAPGATSATGCQEA